MINVMRALAGRSRQLIPQTAVVGSSAIGMISGSGSANAAVIGTIALHRRLDARAAGSRPPLL
jgi:TRAP-type uncharacterized transport system fused permease subunit